MSRAAESQGIDFAKLHLLQEVLLPMQFPRNSGLRAGGSFLGRCLGFLILSALSSQSMLVMLQVLPHLHTISQVCCCSQEYQSLGCHITISTAQAGNCIGSGDPSHNSFCCTETER